DARESAGSNFLHWIKAPSARCARRGRNWRHTRRVIAPPVVYRSAVADRMTREQRRATMARVRNRDTDPEIALRRALWAAGIRGWRCHPRAVPGRPDLAWVGRQVAVFVDGAFWHGHPDHYWGQSGKFWDEKIARKRARDERVN